MSDYVNPPSGQPLYYSRELAFDKFEVDAIQNQIILYMYRKDVGEIHRITLWFNASTSQFRTISIWKPCANETMPLPVWTMAFHRSNRKNWLYMTTDSAVVQLSPEQCDSYVLCTQCVRDAYCGWNVSSNSCQKYTLGLLQASLSDDLTSTCGASCTKTYQRVNTVPGMAIHMNCSSYCPPSGEVEWWFWQSGTPSAVLLPTDSDQNYVISRDGGLTILMVNGSKHSGSFQCRSSGQVLTRHDISLSVCEYGDNVRETWIREYMNWCENFSLYYTEYNRWKCVRDHCMATNCIQNITECS
jgi:hypothetical protein